MPTIKTKKEMNLPELIEWASKKDIKDEKFYSKNGCHISIDFRGHVFLWDIRLNEIFTVEVEEEITEDTVIPKLLTIFKSNPLKLQDDRGKQRAFVHNSESIQYILNKAKSQRENIDTIHIINDDNTHTLIWKNGKLVE